MVVLTLLLRIAKRNRMLLCHTDMLLTVTNCFEDLILEIVATLDVDVSVGDASNGTEQFVVVHVNCFDTDSMARKKEGVNPPDQLFKWHTHHPSHQGSSCTFGHWFHAMQCVRWKHNDCTTLSRHSDNVKLRILNTSAEFRIR